MTTLRFDPISALTDEALVDELAEQTKLLRDTRNRAQELEYAVLFRCQAKGATSLFGTTYEARLEATRSYVQERLTPLLELLAPEGLAESYVAPHTQMVEVPAKWDVTQAKKWARKAGTVAQAVIEAAAIPGAPKVKLEVRK